MDASTDMTTVDIRDQLASERTHLAWIRSGLALMGLGLVVARVGLLLQELQAAQACGLTIRTDGRSGSGAH